MPRPKVSNGTQKRLKRVARDVSDEVGNMSHEEALEAVLDHIEEDDSEEFIEEIGEGIELGEPGQQQERDPFGGVSTGRARRDRGGFR